MHFYLIHCHLAVVVLVAGYAQPDHGANKRIYGKEVSPTDILEGKVPPPSAFSFRGFGQLVDDLHVVEGFGADNTPPKFQRKSSQPRKAWRAYETVPGFHRFGSNNSRS